MAQSGQPGLQEFRQALALTAEKLPTAEGMFQEMRGQLVQLVNEQINDAAVQLAEATERQEQHTQLLQDIIRHSIDAAQRHDWFVQRLDQNNNLLERVGRQFDNTVVRLESMDTRLERLESTSTRLEIMDTRLESMNTRLESMDTRLENMDTRLESMDTRLESMDAGLNNTDTLVDQHFDDVYDYLQQLKDDVNQANEGVGQVRDLVIQAEERLNATLSLNDRRMGARILNSTARIDSDKLTPVPLPNGELPGPDFPADIGALRELPGPTLSDLLVRHQVVANAEQVPHSVPARRKLYSENLGVRLFS